MFVFNNPKADSISISDFVFLLKIFVFFSIINPPPWNKNDEQYSNP